MPLYERAPKEINELAAEILCKYDTHKPLLDFKVRIDYIIALKDGEGDYAIKWHGSRAYGLARILGLKDRAMGRGDAEILIDGDWRKEASEKEMAALLDHELHHLEVQVENGKMKRDALARPKLKMRKHDFQVGWFHVIAQRHKGASIEYQQANHLLAEAGQLYFPELLKLV